MTQDETCINYRVVKPSVKIEPASTPSVVKTELMECIDYEHILKDYFQLDIDLESLYRQWSLADPNFNQVAKNFAGVRMLRQDPVENLFAFICSSNNNIQRFVSESLFKCTISIEEKKKKSIPRITGMVEKLCENYGNQLLTHQDVAYYSFPALESLAADKVESRLRTLGFGYRAKFIQQSAAKMVENGGRDWLMNLRKVSYPEAKTALMTLPGIGAKVSDNSFLFKIENLLFYFIFIYFFFFLRWLTASV